MYSEDTMERFHHKISVLAFIAMMGMFVPGITFAGPGPSMDEIRAHPPLELEKYPTYHSTLSEKLLRAMERQRTLRRKLNPRGMWTGIVENIPPDLYPPQLQDTYQWGSILFVFVRQPEMDAERAAIEEYSGRGPIVRWAGVLASSDHGHTWEKFFSVPVAQDLETWNAEYCRWSFSPIAMFIDARGRIFIDVKNDDCGAGSGEGELIRFVSSDLGYTWTWNACLYFIPEFYYRYPSGWHDRFELRPMFSLTRLKRINHAQSPRMPQTDCPYGTWQGFWEETRSVR